MTFFPDMKTVLTFGSLHVTWYAILILTGAFLTYYLCIRQFKKWGYDEEIFENFFLYMLPIAIIGARLYYVIFEWNNQYAANPISAFYIWEGGLAIHGGIIAATIFGLLYFRKHCYNGLRIADVIFPNLLIAQAIGRWGNFLNQEAYGQVVSGNYYAHWPAFIRENMYIEGQFRQPTFLYESVGNLIGFVLITFVYKKYGRKKRGDLAFAYITWYGMVRFIVEGFRSDSLMIGPLRIAQVISLIGIVIGVLGIFGVWDRLFKNIFPFKKKKPAIIFDLDGTLVDTKELIYKSFIHTFEKYKPGYHISDEELQSFLGPTLHQSFSKYFEVSQVPEIIAYYRAFNHEHHDEYIKEIPHVKETLTYLKEHDYALAVMSNKLTDIVKMGLAQFQLTPYFEVILGGEDVEEPKPSPMGILKACELLHCSHDDVIYIGDAPTDIQACKNMGAFSVAFIYEENRAIEMQKENPCAIITDMKDLLRLVEEEHEWSDVTI
ncbi:MAG: prolipoprotein diacylglyceryl transferase [Longicatena sp.]